MSRQFFRHAAVMMVGTVAAQMLQVLLSPVLTRLFAPAQFGEFQTVVSVAALLAVVFTGRYELAIVLAAGNVEGHGVARLAMRLALVASSVCIALIVGVQILGWRTPPLFSGVLPYFMVTLALLIAFSQIGAGWANRLQSYKRLSMSVIAQQGVTGCASMLLGFLAILPHGLVLGRLIGQASAAITLYWSITQAPRIAPSAAHPESLASIARKFQQFPRFNVAYSLIASAGRDFLVLIFAFTHDLAAAGAYGLARSIAYLPMTFMSAALSQVFYREAANAEKPAVEALALQLLQAMAVALVPAFTVLAFFGAPLFAVLFGERWSTAGDYAAILAVPAALAVASSCFERFYEVARRQKVALIVQVCFDGISVLLIATLIFGGMPALWAVIAYAILNALYNIVYLVCAWYVSGLAPRALLKPARLSLLVAAIAAVACLLLQSLPIDLAAAAMVAAAASIAHLLLLSYRWRGLVLANSAEDQ